MSGGEQLRDFMPIEAAAETIVRLALHVPQAGVVNICSGQPVSVRGMIERWLQQNNWQMQLQLGHYPYPDYEPMAFWGSNQRLNRMLSTLPT
jgi:dTDP-6-deoxy-L-talose 4-dehydrogenase (NAD+)